MSAYQVNENCLYNVINLVSKCGSYGEYYKELPALINQSKDKPKDLFNRLIELNRFSLVERYGDKGLEFEVKFNEQGLIKSMMQSNQYQQLKIPMLREPKALLFLPTESLSSQLTIQR